MFRECQEFVIKDRFFFFISIFSESQAVKEVRRIHDEKEEEYKKEREELMKKVFILMVICPRQRSII